MKTFPGTNRTKLSRFEEERENETIFDLWMACYTQDQIAEATGLPQRTVADRIAVLAEKFPGTKSLKLSEYGEDGWTPPLFDIWNADRNNIDQTANNRGDSRAVQRYQVSRRAANAGGQSGRPGGD